MTDQNDRIKPYKDNPTKPIEEKKDWRLFAEDMVLYHDLFKLEVATMAKDISWNETPEYLRVEHVHFYHTIDSDGRKQEHSTATGGHFHEVKLVPQEKGPPKLICKSGPMTWSSKKVRGKRVKILRDVNDEDTHKHKTTYLKSDKLMARKVNTEALKLISSEANKEAGLARVGGDVQQPNDR